MRFRVTAAVIGIVLFGACNALPGRAENQMGYRLLTQQEANMLPVTGGGLGMDVERARQITDEGMTFDIMRVQLVRPGSAGDQAGFQVGDQIIAVNGRVFASLGAFGAYIRSLPPGREVDIDYMPAGAGPQQAERVVAVIGSSGPRDDQPGARMAAPGGMSAGKKIAIGAGAVALLGCYEMGCFSHRSGAQVPGSMGQPVRSPVSSPQR